MKLRHGRYIGPREDLYGEMALIGENFGPMIEIQFDDINKFGINTLEHLALGWHKFPEIDFQIFDEPTDGIPPILQFIVIVAIVIWAFVIFGTVSMIAKAISWLVS